MINVLGFDSIVNDCSSRLCGIYRESSFDLIVSGVRIVPSKNIMSWIQHWRQKGSVENLNKTGRQLYTS